MTTSSAEYQEIVKKMTEEVINEIEMDIENRVIEVAKEKVDVKSIIEKQEMRKKSKKSSKKTHKPTLDELREIKQSKLVELREIQRKQETIKKSFVLEKSKISHSGSKVWRSEFTEEEMAEIKKIIKSHRQFQKQLIQKQQNLQAWLLEKKKQEEELKKQEIAQICEQRRKLLAKQREELQKRKQQEALRLQQEIKKLKQLKAKKLLHEKMSESWKKYQETSEAEKQRLWEQQKEKKRLAAKELHQHETKYLEMKKSLDKKREETLQHSRSLKTNLPYIHASIFYKVQKQQQEKAKQEEIKSHQRQDFITKKRLYSKQVSELFLPKVKMNSSRNQADQNKQSMTKLPLNTGQTYKLGNDYMKSVHQKVTVDQLEKQKKSLIIPEQKGGNSNFYKNYLKDIKSEHIKENTMTAVESTLRNQRLNSTDKLQKVKMIFEKEKGKKKTDSELIETIKSKMKVLQEIVR